MTLQERLRHEAQTLRTKSMPLKHLIPLLQQAADALDTAQQERKPMTNERKKALVSDWFAEDWAQEKALKMLDDYEAFHGIKETP